MGAVEPSVWQAPRLTKRLGSESKGLVFLTDLDCSRRVQLAHIDILELQHEPYPVVRIPVERDSADLLLAAIDPAGYGF